MLISPIGARVMRKLVADLVKMKSAGSRGVLQILHVHVLLVAPLGTGHMAQAGTNYHEGGVAIWESAHHMGPAADFPVEPFNDIIDPDASPVLERKVAVGQRLLDAVFHLFGGLLPLHRPQFFHNGSGFRAGRFLALLSMDGLEHFGHQLHLGTRCNREYVAVSEDWSL